MTSSTVRASLAVDALIEAMYRAALEPEAGEFSRVWLRRFAERVPYGLAVWDAREADGTAVTRRFARGQSLEEPLSAESLAAGEPSPSRLRLSFEGDGGLVHMFAFARDSHQAFEETEQAALHVLCRHLIAAEALCHRAAQRIEQLQSSDRDDETVGHASVNGQGRVLAVDDRFVRHIRSALRVWKPEHLPFEFKWSPEIAAKGIAWRGLFVRVTPAGEQFHLRIRKDRRASKVTEKERKVAEMAADGQTFQEIGRALKLAPSTASTHLYNLYAKLGIRDKNALREWLATQPAYSEDVAVRAAPAREWLKKELAQSFRLVPKKKI